MWIFGDTQYPQNDTARTQDAQHIYQDLGDYTATLMIEDENTCKDTITRTITINPVPTAMFTLTENWEEKQGQVKLDNQSVGTTELIYDWYFDDGDTSQQVNPIHQYLYDSDPIYNLMLIATNNYGCPDTLIYPYELLFTGLYVPNAFSPSLEDPTFNTFKPVGINLSEYKLEVFSSWGNMVFTSTQLVDGQVAQGWDGTFEGEDLPTGVYIWRITARFSDGSYWRGSDNGDGNLETHGTVTLIR
jgi:PKD repeat protein